jgi:PAS domain S-box-containing protein
MRWVERAEPQVLRRCISDLLALSALPAMWNTSDATQIADSVAAALIPILDAEVVYLSLPGDYREAIEVIRSAVSIPATAMESLRTELRRAAAAPSEPVGTLNYHAGAGSMRFAAIPIGFRKAAWLLAASRHPHFPSDAQRFLLGAAANEATLGLLRQRAEASERRLLSVIERAPDFIGVASLEGIPQSINPAGLKLVGLGGIEEAWEHTILDFVAPHERPRLQTAWQTVIEHGAWSGEVMFRHFGSGDSIPFLVDWFRIDDPRTGQPIHLATVSRDLREQKRLEKSLQNMNEQLERRVDERTRQLAAVNDRLNAEMVERRRSQIKQHALQLELAHASRLGVAGEMAAAIAHELNQPLTAVANSMSAARRLLMADRNTVYDIIVEAEEQIVRAAQIIRRLRDFVSGTKAEKRLEELHPMIEEALALALTGSGVQDVKVDIQFDKRPIRVFADKIQIQQVVVNLVRNAIEAMSDAPRKALRISTALLDVDTVEIAVSDNGPGVAEEMLGNLFEPFHSTKHDGMGLGLSICRTIVEAHGGELSYDPLFSEGATFRLTLRTLNGKDDDIVG